MATDILRIEDLHTYFFTKEGEVKAVNGVNLSLKEGGILGVVGESGAGKSVTALSILSLVPFPGRIVKGAIHFKDMDLLALTAEELRRIRGKEIAMIFQDATTALNPVVPIGTQVEEGIVSHTGMSKREARNLAEELLRGVGLANPQGIMKQYTFQISGGMSQRVMLAIATALNPRVLIADEPTSSLDVTLQAEMLGRLRRMRDKEGSSILLITHNLGVIAQMAEEVVVMYGGRVVERTNTRALFARPRHPYTWGLLQAVPRLDDEGRRLRPMRGAPPNMLDVPDECPFLARCPKATNACRLNPMPPLEEIEPGHYTACYNPIVHD